jgi:Na+-transporting NADH:ubiquinone oxidoreductase subunit NqrB
VSIAAASIGSKFFVRYRGKHVFNPTNFGLAAGTLLSCPVWISPGQWGDAVVFAAAAACLGALVVNRALRSDVTAAFLVSYAALLVWRAVYLGDPWEIPLHQIANGGVIIFAFFMISDPRSTPDSRFGRVLFGVAVAYAAYKIRFTYYTPNALIWSLFFMSPIVPALDGLLKGGRFEWSQCTARAPVKVPV